MLTAARARLRGTGDDDGMTLTELIVGMGLLVVAGTLALNFFVGTSNEANRTTDESLAAAGARTAIDQISAVLRVADTPTTQPGYATARFTTVSPTEVVLYSNVSATGRSGSGVRLPPSKVDIKLANRTLTEYVYAPKSTTYGSGYDWTQNYPTAPTSTVVLATAITNTDVFTYCSAATDPSRTCTTTTSPASVSLVQVKLTVAGLTGESSQTVQSGVAITGAVS